MVYIFEDHPDADISVLFKNAYAPKISQNFIYAQGNGNLESLVRQQLSLLNNKDNIAVFMDMIPGNKDCFYLYNKLRLLSRQNNYIVIILPLICAEYYMLRSIKDNNLFFDIQEKQYCVQKRPHILSDIMQHSDKALFCKNFEKYCKYVLKYNAVSDCIKPYNKISDLNGQYYHEDCKCKISNNNCNNMSLQDKALQLIYEYPCVPSGSYALNLKPLLDDQIWQVHRILVDEYNAFTDEYIKVDHVRSNIYKKIKYIK